MNDRDLMFAILILGGAAFLFVFLTITIASVRESKANEPPADLTH